jgi:hypothetical protein
MSKKKSQTIRPFGDERSPRECEAVEVRTRDGRQLFAVFRRGVLGAHVYVGEDGKPIDGVTVWRERLWGELRGAG